MKAKSNWFSLVKTTKGISTGVGGHILALENTPKFSVFISTVHEKNTKIQDKNISLLPPVQQQRINGLFNIFSGGFAAYFGCNVNENLRVSAES